MRIFINIYRAVMQKYRPLNLLCVYTSVKVSGRRQRENNMGTSLWQLVREASSELLSWLSLCWQGEQQLSWVHRIELLTLKLTEAVGLKPPTQTSFPASPDILCKSLRCQKFVSEKLLLMLLLRHWSERFLTWVKSELFFIQQSGHPLALWCRWSSEKGQPSAWGVHNTAVVSIWKCCWHYYEIWVQL